MTEVTGLESSESVPKKRTPAKKLVGCEGCTRKDKCKHPFLGRVPDIGDIAIIVPMPTKTEDDTFNAWSAPLWLGLDKLMMTQGLDTSRYVWVYANPCHNTDDVTVAVEKKCHNNLMDYLKLCEVKYALLVGASSMNIFSNGKHKAITKERGGVIECEGVTAVPVSNYGDVLRDLELLDTFKADLGFFQRLVTDSFKKPKLDMLGMYSPLGSLAMRLKDASCVAYDLETSGFDHRKGPVKMVGVAWRNSYGSVFSAVLYPKETPFNVPDVHKWEWSDITDVLKASKRTCAHNSKFDDGWLQSRSVPAYCNMDTMLAAYCDNHMMPHGLKFLAKHLLGAPHYNEGIVWDDLSNEMRDKMEYYCQLDCYYTLLLREYYLEHSLEFGDVPGDYKKVLVKLLMPGTRVLERIEARGVHVDKTEVLEAGSLLQSNKADAKHKLDMLVARLLHRTDPINYDSPAQLRKLLYGKKSEGGFGYKPIYKERDPEDDDDPTTGKSALKILARKGSEFCKVLLEYRGHSKALSGFIEPWLEMLEDGDRLFPSYNIGRTATGRLSAYNPNLQQVSRDKLIRNLIKPTPGWLFVESDFSQLELRIAAWVGRIHSMRKIFEAGGDIHTETAKGVARLAGQDWELLTKVEKKDYRQKSKAINFGYIFGMQAEGFQEYASSGYDLDLSIKECKESRNLYLSMYPEVQDWHDRTRREVRRDKYTMSPFGRLRRLPNADSVDSRLVSKALRCGMNTPVQSAASDITVLGMIDLEEAFYPHSDKVRMIGQCHDAIFFEVHPKYITQICQHIYDIMTQPRLDEFGIYMDVPLDVEIKYGRCWSDPENKVFEPGVK